MEISPFQMLRLLISSFELGLIMGIFCDIQYFIRLLLRLEEMDSSVNHLYEKKYFCVDCGCKRRQGGSRIRVIRTVVFWIEDLCFWGAIAIGIVVINYTFNDGKNRVFTFLGILVGFLIYRVLLKKLVRCLLQRIVFLWDLLFSWIFYMFFHPVSKFSSFLCEKVKKITKKIHKSIAKKKEKVYNLYVRNCYFQKADEGFLNLNIIKRQEKDE